MKEKKKIVIVILILLLLAIGISTIVFKRSNNPALSLLPDENASSWQGKQELDKPKTEIKQIAIPGFDSLVFISGQTMQRVNFYNPKENDCLIVFSLHIDDKELWRSGYVEPEKGYYSIELNEPLETGTYKASLLHECYKPDGTPLNSANIDFTLIVQEG